MKNLLSKDINVLTLNTTRFEYAQLRKEEIIYGYIHIDYYLDHKSEYKDYDKVCPRCGCPVNGRNNKDIKNCWYGDHTCYSQPFNITDTGKIIFEINKILGKSEERPDKKTHDPDGPGEGGDSKPGTETPTEFPPINKPKDTNIISVKQAWELYEAKLGYIKADNGLNINQLVCDKNNFNQWKGNLDGRTAILDLVPCKPNDLKLPKKEQCIWLKMPSQYDSKNTTYILLIFTYEKDFKRYYAEIVGYRDNKHFKKQKDKPTHVRVMGNIESFKCDLDLNLYQMHINYHKCIHVKNRKRDENE